MNSFESIENRKAGQDRESTPETNQREPMRVFVDFGAGRHPVAEVDPKRFQGKRSYIGVDYDAEELRLGKKAFSEKQLGDVKTNALFVHTEKGSVPVEDRSVDEIFFGNVFGEPYRKDFKKDGGEELISEFKGAAEIVPLVEEARRVLKDGGTLIVLETSTPVDSNEKVLKKILKKNDFKIERIIRAGDQEFEVEWRKYDSFHTNVPAKENPMGRPYILYARKMGAQ